MAGGINEPVSAFISEERRRRLGNEQITTGEDGEHPPTLIESEIETLYSGFQKSRKGSNTEDHSKVEKDYQWQELEERSRRLRKEEQKVRALNSNGRVDYSIQEGVCQSPRVSITNAYKHRPSTFPFLPVLQVTLRTGRTKMFLIS